MPENEIPPVIRGIFIYLFIFLLLAPLFLPANAPKIEKTIISEWKRSEIAKEYDADISFGKNKVTNIYVSIRSPPEKSPESSAPLPIFRIQKRPERNDEI